MHQNKVDEQYQKLLANTMLNGSFKENRTGIGAYSIFGYQMEIPIKYYFPLLTTKKVNMKAIFYELIWMLRGETNIRYLNDHGVHIWDNWASLDGELGPVYGFQWRHYNGDYYADWFGGVDQISNIVEQIKNNPTSRRMLLTAWNPSQIDDMQLPPCHCFAQFFVNRDKLSCQVYIRSNDVFLGCPFNIAQYSLLTYILAKATDLRPNKLIYTIGDAHLYQNHLEQAREQMLREPYSLPSLTIHKELNSIEDIEEMIFDDISINNYKHHPALKATVAV